VTTKQSGEVAAVMVPVAALKPWVKNPRKNDPAVDAIVASIRRWGFASPIIARAEDGEVIAGHTRLKAAIRLGLKSVPVRYMDLTPAEAHALALADNQLGTLAHNDTAGLVDVIRELAATATPLEEIGFSGERIDKLLGRLSGGTTRTIDPDAEETAAKSKPGKTYHLGGHRLVCGETDPAACDWIRREWTKHARATGIDAGKGALDG
jgi:ParB-like chromosome segregation protein Spo0J